MQSNNNQKSVINGLFIYHDPKKGCVYYDFISKNGYILTKSDYSTYSKFSMLKLLSLTSIYLLIELLNFKLWQALITGISLFIIIEIIFRKTFIYKLPIIHNYQRCKKENIYVGLSRNMSYPMLILSLLASLSLAILMVLYAYTEKYTGINLVCSYILSFAMCVTFVIGVIALIYKIKKKTDAR